MKIGILGTGHIGKTLVRKLSEAGHDVKAANSRGPASIGPDILSSGGRAVTAEDAVTNVDVVILSIPFNKIPDVAPLLSAIPDETVVIDTSNYYPARDERIDAVEAGQVESLWVAEQLGRPIAKAWNAIGTASLPDKGKPGGEPGRVAVPDPAERQEVFCEAPLSVLGVRVRVDGLRPGGGRPRGDRPAALAEPRGAADVGEPLL